MGSLDISCHPNAIDGPLESFNFIDPFLGELFFLFDLFLFSVLHLIWWKNKRRRLKQRQRLRTFFLNHLFEVECSGGHRRTGVGRCRFDVFDSTRLYQSAFDPCSCKNI